jgi:hypothetical protein
MASGEKGGSRVLVKARIQVGSVHVYAACNLLVQLSFARMLKRSSALCKVAWMCAHFDFSESLPQTSYITYYQMKT